MGEKTIVESVKELREALDINQVTLSVRLGKSLSMIQRYERGENIPARDLAVMAQFAREAKRPDLAALFKASVIDVVGPEVVELIREGTLNDDPREETAPERKGDKRRIPA